MPSNGSKQVKTKFNTQKFLLQFIQLKKFPSPSDSEGIFMYTSGIENLPLSDHKLL